MFQALEKAWKQISTKSSSWDQQFLTKDDIVLPIAMCIEFVSSHGITATSVYRIEGRNSKVQKVYTSNLNPIHMG